MPTSEQLTQQSRRNYLDRSIEWLFRASIILKGTLSGIEILAGFAVLFITPSKISHVVIGMILNELTEDPTSFLSSHVAPVAHELALQFSVAPRAFIAIYLLSRGTVKLALVIALLNNKLWAYPASLVVLWLFMLYQIYSIITDFSLPLVILTLFDVVVMWLIWKEYRMVRARRVAVVR